KKTTKKAATRPARQTTVIGKKPSTVQAAEYGTDNAALERKQADDLLMSAMGLLGVSYRFGGSNPASGLDCSGFIQYIFREAMNVNLPRTSAAMAEVGVAVEKADLKPGDLVFFRRGKARIGHVGMYIGDGKFIHAPRTGKSIEIQDLNRTYYVKNYAGARRVSNNAARAARFIQ
ncbi:MAG: C40 family peptidase, partial [Neisseria sp.]|nr:C40 family peptidase [Neisseria sp.]